MNDSAISSSDSNTSRSAAGALSGHGPSDAKTLPSAGVLARVLDDLNVALLLTDSDARVLHMNKGAREIVAAGTGLQVAQGQLNAGSDPETIRLRQLIKKAAASAEMPGRSPRHFGMSLDLGVEGGWQAIVIAGQASGAREETTDEVRAAIFVGQSEDGDSIPNEILRALFGLTASEATLATGLLEGKGVGTAANKSAIGVNTARSHLKKVFWKTQTSRQAELVRILLKSVGVVRFD